MPFLVAGGWGWKGGWWHFAFLYRFFVWFIKFAWFGCFFFAAVLRVCFGLKFGCLLFVFCFSCFGFFLFFCFFLLLSFWGVVYLGLLFFIWRWFGTFSFLFFGGGEVVGFVWFGWYSMCLSFWLTHFCLVFVREEEMFFWRSGLVWRGRSALLCSFCGVVFFVGFLFFFCFFFNLGVVFFGWVVCLGLFLWGSFAS